MKKPARSSSSKYVITFSFAWLFVVVFAYIYIEDFQISLGIVVDRVVENLFGSDD